MDTSETLLGVDYRTEAEQARHPIAGSPRLYDVQIALRDGTRETVTDAVLVTTNADTGAIEIEYGQDSSVTVAVANVQFIHTKAHVDAELRSSVPTCVNWEYQNEGTVARCGFRQGHSGQCYDSALGVRWTPSQTHMTIHDTRERCSDIGPRIGDERQQCVRVRHATDDGAPHQAWYEEGLITW